MTIQRRQDVGGMLGFPRFQASRAIAITVAIAIAGVAGAAHARARNAQAAAIPLAASRMIIEFNSSAEDIGIQVFLDQSSGWREIEIIDPLGREIFGAEAEGALVKQGGGTELFLESVEPPLDELPLDVFFQRFPEGVYKFRGRTVEGQRVTGSANFSHDVPAGPVLVSPVPGAGECAEAVPLPAVISWQPVTTSIDDEPLEIVKYEVIVENDDVNFDVILPASAGTTLTVPPQVLEPGTDYIFEVLAIEEGGNQTITEGCFTTAN
jgi:hypothetical protein